MKRLHGRVVNIPVNIQNKNFEVFTNHLFKLTTLIIVVYYILGGLLPFSRSPVQHTIDLRNIR